MELVYRVNCASDRSHRNVFQRQAISFGFPIPFRQFLNKVRFRYLTFWVNFSRCDLNVSDLFIGLTRCIRRMSIETHNTCNRKRIHVRKCGGFLKFQMRVFVLVALLRLLIEFRISFFWLGSAIM